MVPFKKSILLFWKKIRSTWITAFGNYFALGNNNACIYVIQNNATSKNTFWMQIRMSISYIYVFLRNCILCGRCNSRFELCWQEDFLALWTETQAVYKCASVHWLQVSRTKTSTILFDLQYDRKRTQRAHRHGPQRAVVSRLVIFILWPHFVEVHLLHYQQMFYQPCWSHPGHTHQPPENGRGVLKRFVWLVKRHELC